jgi:hypothetical protein
VQASKEPTVAKVATLHIAELNILFNIIPPITFKQQP